jgi:hypothetical protein
MTIQNHSNNNMNTRSQSKKLQEAKTINNEEKREERENIVLYMVEIDFDEAIDAWRKNKKSIGNGSFKYICCCETNTGKQCKRESVKKPKK